MRRVLVDRHQADLFYSLQLLFEDRLGCLLYTPVGHEWWDEGYWRFGEGFGDDRLAQQYLNPDVWECVTPEQAPGCRQYELFDGHHPERKIRGIELKAVQQTPEWTYAIATVQDNQRGFHRLASEIGARYVVQVGNTGQLVDWGLDPLALVSSEVPIQGRGVLYHQEFDAKTTFRYRPPIDGKVIRSFVNCFPSIECWAMFEEVRDLLPEFTFRTHGIDGPDGNLSNVSEIADHMAWSAFGWHDKIHGDGFGHVIHNWAAVGRPIIGHASHYRGRMAEGFWQDGVTCIDLDKHPVAEAASLIAEIAGDPARHRTMCEAIRAEFDKIDFDAEGETIRAFLT